MGNRNEFNDWKNTRNAALGGLILGGAGLLVKGGKMAYDNAKRNKEMEKSMKDMNARMDKMEESSKKKKKKWF